VSAPPTEPGQLSEPDLRVLIAERLTDARARTETLAAFDDELLLAQHSPLMSPLVWDYAHIGNQEEIWLIRNLAGDTAVRTDVDQMYDAFQNPRAARPTLPLLPPSRARSYVGQVREKVLDLVASARMGGSRLAEAGFAFGMVIQHELQHDETMLATHQLRDAGPPLLAEPRLLAGLPLLAGPPLPAGRPLLAGPPLPAGRPLPAGPPLLAAARPPDARPDLPAEVVVPAGPFTMGTSTEAWALDNERPAREVVTAAYRIDTAPVTNARYLEFMEAGGYEQAGWWSGPGWAYRQANNLTAPLFWQRDSDGSWWRRCFGSMIAVEPDEPVVHVCWYEADAFARWAGRRLPTEVEWEKAARWDPASGRSRRFPWGDDAPTPLHANLDQLHLRPAQVGSYPAGSSPLGVHQLIGDVWEWTSSEFRPYLGFETFPYAEYSEVFFGSDYRVLRGGSFGTSPAACRGTFRNWDYPIRRQIFAGFRTAADVAAGEG
jgi:iron(II)-dependent oxidoreductase